ncbi:MAG: DUF4159 domain-containing protein [Candidatus Solibacter sp.]|nr:DUF4159 domain-containing protein [Candidatus Solibacter sp.]
MTRRRILALATVTVAVTAATAQYSYRQNRWAQYEREMQDPIDDPPDAGEQTEFAFARLRFRSPRDAYFRRYARWGTDSNKSERLFMKAIRRLTRVHTRSIEEIVDIDSDEVFNWPFLYAVGVGDWVFSDSQAARLRKYFERGGFLMVDDFHNEREWASFMAGIRKVFPERDAVEIPDDHPIFHVAYDTRHPAHIPGYQIVYGQEWERGGVGGHYRAIMDAQGKVQVAICFNMDLGDAWEWADTPEYPEKSAGLAFRLGVNYVLYTMTH